MQQSVIENRNIWQTDHTLHLVTPKSLFSDSGGVLCHTHTHTHTSSIKGYALQMCAFVVYKVFGRFTDCLIREVIALPKICCEHHQIY